MQGKRTDRVSHLIQKELSQTVLHKMKDPRIGHVTILHVDVAPDLRSARVYYSVLGDAEQRAGTQTALEKGAGFLQREIGRNLILRCTPRLTFIHDDSFDRGQEIDKVLRKLETEG
ncbi:30S ribosome-binding factor RbfA [Omnitrophica bacterium]|nr:30S ribosome-binding factor RbfA [Candidatus Omnitrophota bacterium]